VKVIIPPQTEPHNHSIKREETSNATRNQEKKMRMVMKLPLGEVMHEGKEKRKETQMLNIHQGLT
jgi:hypothetical protein